MTTVAKAGGRELTPELLDLMEHERAIEQGVTSMLDMAASFEQIRDGRKYRAAGFSSFDDYCEQRWSITRQRVSQVIKAAALARELSTRVTSAPTSEKQLRPLSRLDDPDERAAAWEDAVEHANGHPPTARDVADAVARRQPPAPDSGWADTEPLPLDVDEPPTADPAPANTGRPPVAKPDLGDGISHPARYPDAALTIFADLLTPGTKILDPFAGTGKIHQLRQLIDCTTIGVEIEPEWAGLHPDTLVGDALDLPFDDENFDDTFDAIVTSPTYGNRLADHHDATDPHLRRSYTHDLGRPLHGSNSGTMHWGGPDYTAFHQAAWAEATRVLRPDGRLILNIKDHIRQGDWQDVAGWHARTICALGYEIAAIRPLVTGHLRQGTNADARVAAELIIAFDRKPS